MLKNSILLENLSAEQLAVLMGHVLDAKLEALEKKLRNQTLDDDLMTRPQVLGYLQINASTLWHWQNKGRITVHKFANKCYYKRSELMAFITPLKK